MTEKPTPILPHGWYYNDTAGGDGRSHYATYAEDGWMWACQKDMDTGFPPSCALDSTVFYGPNSYWKKGHKAPICPTCRKLYGTALAVEDLLDENQGS